MRATNTAIGAASDTPSKKSPWWRLAIALVAVAMAFVLTACGGDRAVKGKVKAIGGLSEVSPPAEILRLDRAFDTYEPQVKILSPSPDAILDDGTVAVRLEVRDLPIFKSAELGLGPHVHVTLDNRDYIPVYDLSQPITFENLTPGTHTIQAFASRPWHESFKNEGAYDRVTFHVLTKTAENTPNPQLPLLTYSRPVGKYGAEPVMLDFYLRNVPLHLAALEDESVTDWQVRATVNGTSFTVDSWRPVYLKGLKPGRNWVKLELLDGKGEPIANAFNSSAHLLEYAPGGQDTLSRLVRGETIPNITAIVDPNYVPPAPAIEPPTPTAPVEVPAAAPALEVEPSPTPAAAPALVEPEAPAPAVPDLSEPPAAVPAPEPVEAQKPKQSKERKRKKIRESVAPAPSGTTAPTPEPTAAQTTPPAAIAPSPEPTPSPSPSVEERLQRIRALKAKRSGIPAPSTTPSAIPQTLTAE